MSLAVSVPRPTWFGTRGDTLGALRASVMAAAACAIYVAASATLSAAPSALEVFGTWTSLVCVWLTRRQNIWSMPIGIVSCAAMGVFFFDIELVGQAWLQLAFYIPVQFLGWWAWLRAGDSNDELAVTSLGRRPQILWALATIAGTFAVAACMQRLYGDTPYQLWDASVVAASITAQMLLTWKKTDSWMYWVFPVDISAVALYALTGAHMFAALYALYVVIAASGWFEWRRAEQRRQLGLSAIAARQATGPAGEALEATR